MKYQKKPTMNLLTVLLLFPLLLGCSTKQDKHIEDHDDKHEAETTESTIVHLDRHKLLHTGIQVEVVQNKSIAVPLQLPGKVSFNDRFLADITARVSGRIEKVYVFINDSVTRNTVLLEMYSQEYLSMQTEFLQASERWKRAQLSSPEDKATTKEIYESARRKLAVIGVNEAELHRLEETRTPKMLYVVTAPFPGIILESRIRQGAFVQVGEELFNLADLTTVWVLADIYEKDLPMIRNGMKAHIQVPAYADVFSGTITTIYNVLDEKTRTVKARVEVQNPHMKLKPEMFCKVMIDTQFGKETIKIPANALLGDTEKHFVFVAINDTTFEKRDILTGVETKDFAEVLDGLIVGEKIVVKGGFFLKSELAKETFGEEH